MRCPKCTSIEDKVIDSRISKEGSTIRRRRECLECGHRYSTTEMLVRDGVVVIERDGRREDFDKPLPDRPLKIRFPFSHQPREECPHLGHHAHRTTGGYF